MYNYPGSSGLKWNAARNEDAPLVSVILPVYNAEQRLARCLKSVQNLKDVDMELLIVDDGSTDGSSSICQEAEKSDRRLRYFQISHGGVAAARNYGVKNARGTFIVFVDSDDYVEDDFLWLMLHQLYESNADIAICDYFQDDENSNTYDIDHFFVPENVYSKTGYLRMMIRCPAAHYIGVLWNKIYVRDIILDHHLEFDPRVSVGEDFIFNMQYFHYVDTIACFSKKLYHYQWNSAHSLSSSEMTYDQYINERVILYQAYEEFFRNEKRSGLWNILAQKYMVDQFYEVQHKWDVHEHRQRKVLYGNLIDRCDINALVFCGWSIVKGIYRYFTVVKDAINYNQS